MKSDAKKSLLGMLGLCRRSGDLICGSDIVCTELSSARPPLLVIVAAEASAATVDKVTRKCFHYGVECIVAAVSTEELGHAIGKTGAVATVGMRDANFAKRIKELSEALNSTN